MRLVWIALSLLIAGVNAPAAAHAQMSSHGGLYDPLPSADRDIEIRWIEVAALAFTDEEIGVGWSVGIGYDEWMIGYNGHYIEQDPNDGAPTRDTQLHRISVGIDFLEIYWDTWLSFDIGYAFGERLITSDSFDAADFGARLTLPFINAPSGFPFLHGDVSYSVRPLNGFTEHYTFIAALTVYPFPGGPLRPFGLSLGYTFGEVEDVSFNAFRIGIIFGARLAKDEH